MNDQLTFMVTDTVPEREAQKRSIFVTYNDLKVYDF